MLWLSSIELSLGVGHSCVGSGLGASPWATLASLLAKMPVAMFPRRSSDCHVSWLSSRPLSGFRLGDLPLLRLSPIIGSSPSLSSSTPLALYGFRHRLVLPRVAFNNVVKLPSSVVGADPSPDPSGPVGCLLLCTLADSNAAVACGSQGEVPDEFAYSPTCGTV